jgi:sec-independent protein translocase protein TatB
MGTPPPIEMANLGMADSLILMVLALVVFGPRRLPQIGRQIGKLMYEFRKASNDFKFQMEEELRNAEEADRRKKEEERQRTLALAAPAPAAAESPSSTDGSALAIPAATETANWEESAYPSTIAPAAEAPVEESYPRIQPPSTGEPVPAAMPWSLEEELAKVSGATAGLEPVGQDFSPGIKPAASTEALASEVSSSEDSPAGLPDSEVSKASQTDSPAPERLGAIPEQASHG